jgi:nucleoside-diphosphate-sugar epimerase
LNKILITGASGFVGQNLLDYCSINKLETFPISLRNTKFDHRPYEIYAYVHLAGKAHDFKNVFSEKEYYEINTELTKSIFNFFLKSDATVFIIISSVKAVATSIDCQLLENCTPNPTTHYGKSKLLAEQYILSKNIPEGKRVYILRPCMIHGPGNKGNLNLLYNIVSKGFPWPLGSFENKRSFCSIDNLCFIIKELILNKQVPSGVYNIADDEPISTNELIGLISESVRKKSKIWNIPHFLIKFISKFGDIFKLPFNSERLSKLTETYVVSNDKIKKAINKPLPINAKLGLMKTFNSFYKNVI